MHQQPDTPYTLPNLEELRLGWYGYAADYHHARVQFSKLPNLRRLDLSGIAFTNEDRQYPPNLEYLRFHAGGANWNFISPNPGPLLPRLKSLVFSDINWVCDLSLLWYLDNTSSAALDTLWLDSCLNIGSCLREIAERGYFSHLTELSVSRIPVVDDALVQVLLAYMSRVKVLHLSYTGITGRAVKMLADARVSGEDKAGKVERVFLRGCEDVSFDAVVYGRARGVEIFT